MNHPARRFLILLFPAIFWACDSPPATVSEAPNTEESPATPEILPQPFTAEQIRDEWIEGFQLLMHRRSNETAERERWTVVGWDKEGAEIEYISLDDEGQPTGEPRVEPSTWVELRDHASFPAANATREEATRETALGTLDGWLYTVNDPDQGTVTEFFFAQELPGAPVEFRIMADDEVVMEMLQVERHRPAEEAEETAS
jgi:hypothetical protein